MNQVVPALKTFIDHFSDSLTKDTFVKSTLSKPATKAQDLQNVYIRPVEIKGKRKLSFTYHENQQDLVKNFDADSALVEIQQLLGQSFKNGDLFTEEASYSLKFNSKWKAKLLMWHTVFMWVLYRKTVFHIIGIHFLNICLYKD